MQYDNCTIPSTPLLLKGTSLSCLYDSWIYNYICNKCLSPLMLWVRILHICSSLVYNQICAADIFSFPYCSLSSSCLLCSMMPLSLRLSLQSSNIYKKSNKLTHYFTLSVRIRTPPFTLLKFIYKASIIYNKNIGSYGYEPHFYRGVVSLSSACISNSVLTTIYRAL